MSRRFLKRTGSLAAAVVLLLVLFVWVWRDLRDQTEAAGLVEHTYQVMIAAEALVSTAQDIETGQRGFVLTLQERFLEPYSVALARESGERRRLRQLTADNASQQARLAAVDRLMETKIAYLARTIELARRGDRATVVAMVSSGEGKRIMDELRSLLGDLEQEERLLLLARLHAFDVSSAWTRWSLTLGCCLLVVALLLAGAIIERDTARSEKARAALDKQATLINVSYDAIITADGNRVITGWNHGATEMYGWTGAQALGKVIHDLLHTESEFTTTQIDSTLAREGRWDGELVHTRSDGRRLTCESRQVLARDSSGGPVGMLEVNRDTTERNRAQKALQLSEERYRSLTTVTTQIVWTTNPQGEVEEIPMWRQFTGQSEEQVKGWGWLEALHPEDREQTAEIWSRAVTSRSFYRTEYRMRRHDGEYRWMAVHGVPVFEGEATIREWVGTCADITDRKLAEEEIRRLNQQLEQRVLDRTAQLLEANQELEAFAYSVSHDLRSPLRAVDGFCRILLEEYGPQLPEEAQHYLQVARDNAVQMGELIDGLLKFSRLSRQPLCKQPIAPADLVRQAWEELRLERVGREIEIRVADLAPCEGDALLLKQVFVNLLSNALKYTRAREIARIEVGCEGTGLETSYFVRDNGVGFDIRYRDKLFGVFQRLHRAEEYEGTGVGLATVQRIIHRHGGEVWADAVLNRGATFGFTLPASGKSIERNATNGG